MTEAKKNKLYLSAEIIEPIAPTNPPTWPQLNQLQYISCADGNIGANAFGISSASENNLFERGVFTAPRKGTFFINLNFRVDLNQKDRSIEALLLKNFNDFTNPLIITNADLSGKTENILTSYTTYGYDRDSISTNNPTIDVIVSISLNGVFNLEKGDTVTCAFKGFNINNDGFAVTVQPRSRFEVFALG